MPAAATASATAAAPVPAAVARALANLEPLAAVLRAAGDPTRLRLLALLSQGEQCVCVLHECLALPQPSVSRHLAILRAAGLVAARRDGRWIWYRLLPPRDALAATALRGLVRSFAATDTLKDAVRRTAKKCGPAAVCDGDC